MDNNDNNYQIIDFLDLDQSSSELRFSRDLFLHKEDDIVNLRLENQRAIDAGRHKLVCGYCHRPIQIYGNLRQENIPGQQHYHFRHYAPEVEGDEPCPYRSENELYYDRETLLRQKYRGLPMNPEHDRIQDAIMYWLRKWDNNVEKEKRISDGDHSKSYRKADIYAEIEDKKIVFEVQRTSTSVSTIVGRDDFYRQRGIYILWIITRPHDVNCAKRDIFYDNAENFFVYDDEAAAMSKDLGELCLTCYYCEWMFGDKTTFTRCNELSKKTLPFNQLHFDEKDYKVYYATPDELKRNFVKEIYKPYKRRFDDILKEEKSFNCLNRLKKFYYDQLRGVPAKGQLKAKMETELKISSYLAEVFLQICAGNKEYNQRNFADLLKFVYKEYHISLKDIIGSSFTCNEAYTNSNIDPDLFILLVANEATRTGQIEYDLSKFKADILNAELDTEKCCMMYALHAFTHVVQHEEDYTCIDSELCSNWKFYAVLFSIALDRLNLRFRYKTWPALINYAYQQYPRKMKCIKMLIDWKAKRPNNITHFLEEGIKNIPINEYNECYTDRVFGIIFNLK